MFAPSISVGQHMSSKATCIQLKVVDLAMHRVFSGRSQRMAYPMRLPSFLRGIHMRSLKKTHSTTDQVRYLGMVGEQGAQDYWSESVDTCR